MRHSLRKLNIRLLALAVAAMLLLCAVPVASAAEASGQCGDDLTWSLSGDTLTITGSGPMYNFPESTMAPWYEYRREIAAVHLPDGLTRVGDLAFYGCTALQAVTLPDSVKVVGWHAFDGCSAMVMLSLGSSLTSVDDGAFLNCKSLKSLRLPGTLQSIGYQGFSWCESLTEVTVPESVTEVGMAAFAFCHNLIRADIRAKITLLPEWIFYGCDRLTELTLSDTVTGAKEYAFYDCDSLSTVNYNGSDENRDQIQEDIIRDVEGGGLTSVTDTTQGESASNATYEETDEGLIGQTTTTTQTENADISTNVTVVYPDDQSPPEIVDTQVDITLENGDGWGEVSDYLDEVVNGDSGDVNVDIYIKDDTDVPADILNSYAGTDTIITVHTSSGAVWTVDCRSIPRDTLEEDCSFTYERLNATQAQLDLIGATSGYMVRFNKSVELNAQVAIRVPSEHIRSVATLFQEENRDAAELQSVVIDGEGYACFYLGAVDKDTVYLIGIDVPGVDTTGIIVPDKLMREYGISENNGIEYVITGRKSSWGMSAGQVTWILAAVMIGCVAFVGVFMFALNKRKLKQGYVPKIYDEET